MIDATRLLAVRRQSNNYNGCPVHVPIAACEALFVEAGVQPDPAAVGRLGDIMENFAMTLIEGAAGSRMSAELLGERLRAACGVGD